MSQTDSREIRTYLAFILAAVGTVTLLGTFGFHFFESGHNQNLKSFSDSLWWAVVTITTIGYGDIYPVTTGGRICALFLMFSGIGLLSVSTAGIAAYLVRFNQLEQLRTWGLKDHVVICGLGTMGFLMATAFRRENHRVLVIERDESNDRIQSCREGGAVVIVGNAAGSGTLRRARLDRAKHLIIVCGHDSNNAEVAARAHAMVVGRRAKLGCSVHVVDSDLWHLLRSWDLTTSKYFRLEFFNIFDLGARAMLSQVPPFEPPVAPREAAHRQDIEAAPRPVPHLLVVGSTRLAQNVVMQSIRQWRDGIDPTGPRIRVTMVDDETESVHAALRSRFPGFDHVVDFAAHSVSPRSADFHHAKFLFDEHGNRSVTRVYVCLDDEARAVSAALIVLGRLRSTPVPLIVRMNEDSGLALLLQVVRGRPGYENLHVFGMLESACQPELVMRGTNEVLARALHDEYLASQRALGADLGANAAAVPWEALPLDIKELNRTQADHISTKLQALGCTIGPILDLAAPPVTFKPEEVEILARLEHERWLAERRVLGWTVGPRDVVRKTNPNMLPWNELGEDARTLTRNMVRQLPGFLASVGLVVYRESA